jgi:hypothetical protein
MSGVTTKAKSFAAVLVASGGFLLAAPMAASAAPAGSPPNNCSGLVDLHQYSGVDVCLKTPGGTLNLCDIDYISNGNNWVAFYWGLGLPANNYHPGTGPGSWWAGGTPWCIGTVNINT